MGGTTGVAQLLHGKLVRDAALTPRDQVALAKRIKPRKFQRRKAAAKLSAQGGAGGLDLEEEAEEAVQGKDEESHRQPLPPLDDKDGKDLDEPDAFFDQLFCRKDDDARPVAAHPSPSGQLASPSPSTSSASVYHRSECDAYPSILPGCGGAVDANPSLRPRFGAAVNDKVDQLTSDYEDDEQQSYVEPDEPDGQHGEEDLALYAGEDDFALDTDFWRCLDLSPGHESDDEGYIQDVAAGLTAEAPSSTDVNMGGVLDRNLEEEDMDKILDPPPPPSRPSTSSSGNPGPSSSAYVANIGGPSSFSTGSAGSSTRSLGSAGGAGGGGGRVGRGAAVSSTPVALTAAAKCGAASTTSSGRVVNRRAATAPHTRMVTDDPFACLRPTGMVGHNDEDEEEEDDNA
ncbi:hypothetical protein JCM8097_002884 [Rhodosporidiobolus ruineniae]